MLLICHKHLSIVQVSYCFKYLNTHTMSHPLLWLKCFFWYFSTTVPSNLWSENNSYSGRTCLINHMCSTSQVWIDNMRLGVYIVLLIINNQENGQSHTPMQHTQTYTQANTAESKSTKKWQSLQMQYTCNNSTMLTLVLCPLFHVWAII